MDTFKETEVIICECSSMEHQAKFYYEKPDGVPYDLFAVLIHLNSGRGFFYRLWYGLKYIFGFKSRYGAWDELLIGKEDRKKLYEFLKDTIE